MHYKKLYEAAIDTRPSAYRPTYSLNHRDEKERDTILGDCRPADFLLLPGVRCLHLPASGRGAIVHPHMAAPAGPTETSGWLLRHRRPSHRPILPDADGGGRGPYALGAHPWAIGLPPAARHPADGLQPAARPLPGVHRAEDERPGQLSGGWYHHPRADGARRAPATPLADGTGHRPVWRMRHALALRDSGTARPLLRPPLRIGYGVAPCRGRTAHARRVELATGGGVLPARPAMGRTGIAGGRFPPGRICRNPGVAGRLYI